MVEAKRKGRHHAAPFRNWNPAGRATPSRLSHSSLPSVSAFPSPSPSLSGSFPPLGPGPPLATQVSVLLSSFWPSGQLHLLPLPSKLDPSGQLHTKLPLPSVVRTEWSGQLQPL